MSKELVRLPRNVASAIDEMKYMGVVAIMANMAHWSEEDPTTEELYTIHEYYLKNPYLIACALVSGHEIEETAEDKVRTYYEKCTEEGHEWERTHPHANSGNPYFTEMQGIAKTLGILNIKIEGVNA